jgi:hypothetical protein
MLPKRRACFLRRVSNHSGDCEPYANMAVSITDDAFVVEGKTATHGISDEKVRSGSDVDFEKKEAIDTETSIDPALSNDDEDDQDTASDDVIIITGADAAAHLLPLRDDHEPSLTFRSIFLATCLSAFQAVMSQIYQVNNIPFTKFSPYRT